MSASPDQKHHLLIVEDEANIRDLVCLHLESEGYDCLGAADGMEAYQLLQSRPFDAVVLDVMLPGMSGLTLCRNVRSGRANREVPILFLTARANEPDKLAGFRNGGDDYLTKPFSMLELSARIGALTRRTRGMPVDPLAHARVVEVAGLTLDPAKRSMLVGGQNVPLTPHEFRLIYELAASRGVVFTRGRLLSEVWQGEAYVTERSIDTLVHRLRCKIEKDPSQPQLILTVWGEGYKFNDV